ncbi:uncharacterized protein M421DRAFT_4126 [Didymella exigua CBS 183.55]|uniref:HAD-like protein n=1 Tax=Didymella exigua CBS 183.55 TaxID=1150837 RepID=A0A6A5RTM0_9PLEO|nr:uncharacterized protein M421DRAFT_4126 [Didymella exigua CBS 183.55]KAF1929676.1 hypothetical protein M421DRAFT_4126 [Didymella exigua CBS 183.55]
MTARPALDPTQPIHWILDWDGTITRRDTLDALVSIAASAKPGSPVLEEWKRVSEAYKDDYTAALEKLAPGDKLPSTVKEERKLLLALRNVEQTSLERVSASGIFAGLTQKLLEEGASNAIDSRKVEIRDGCTEFLQSKRTNDYDSLDLLSVNWSRHFISSCLMAANTPVGHDSIYANELDGIEANRTSHGIISPKGEAKISIISSSDKLEYMTRLKEQDKRTVVYVGDSWTDIECLLEADLGICIRDEPIGSSQKKLAERLQSLGVHCPHLSASTKSGERQVVWARDFADIQAWTNVRNAHNAQST